MGGFSMKTSMRVIALILSAIVGLWVLGHGIVLAVTVHHLPGENQSVLDELVESAVSIAGGICVLSVAVEQLNCWRTHRKEDSLI
ncbi:MAG: hypothetical protein ACRD3I_06485 [Terriglobales bacterium]